MSRRKRSEEISRKVSGDYHVTSKCSRSLHLLVPEEASDLPEGAVPEHPDGRKDLLLGRLRFLAGVMAIDVSAFSVMANHLHLVVRTRIEEALAWSPEEVVDRWRILHPHRDRRQKPRETTAADRAADLANRFFVKECRRKLLDVSQFMKELKQFVAQEVNKLEGVPGALWAGRFKAERIGDPAALVEVMVYIDLNPFRAGLCPTPEAGRHTSLSARLGWLHAEREAGAKAAAGSAEGWLLPLDAAVEQRHADEPLAEGAQRRGACGVCRADAAAVPEDPRRRLPPVEAGQAADGRVGGLAAGPPGRRRRRADTAGARPLRLERLCGSRLSATDILKRTPSSRLDRSPAPQAPIS